MHQDRTGKMAEMSHLATLGIFAVLIFMSFRDLNQHADAQKMDKEIPAPKLASKFAGPTLKFLFWKVYEQFTDVLHQKYPHLNIQGDNFPPGAMRQMIAQIIGYVKLMLIGLIVVGQNPFTWFAVQTPAAYNWAMENKMYACMMLFFVSNAIEGQLISTGAFEITYNDVPVWSKLETGRIPSPQEIFQIIDNHMRLTQ